ncbi:MAG: hypothetical protein ACXVDA_24790 [Ktedonobacterales bacterium]
MLQCLRYADRQFLRCRLRWPVQHHRPFLAVAPWVTDDPGVADPDLSLAERRKQLRTFGKDLLPGGRHAGQYRESVIWANLHVRSAEL